MKRIKKRVLCFHIRVGVGFTWGMEEEAKLILAAESVSEWVWDAKTKRLEQLAVVTTDQWQEMELRSFPDFLKTRRCYHFTASIFFFDG